jgi:hypothetical protein
MYGVVRRYPHFATLARALTENTEEVQALLTGVPGFVAYYAVRSGSDVATITVCADQAGTAESTRRAADWVRRQGLGGGSAPEVTEGEVFLHF